MKTKPTLVCTGIAIALALGGAGSNAADAVKPPACQLPEHRQLDFWVGDWDVYDMPGTGKRAAHATITSLMDKCVIHELYEGENGGRGESFSIFDRSRNVWHQTWVTNRGTLLMIEGTLRNGRLVLSGEQLTDDHKRTIVRAAWWPDKEGVRELGETSEDGGKTWKTEFDLIFKRRP